jgi:hypothetical protein
VTDLPWQDPRRPHRVAFEGWYWRFTDPGSGRVVVALCSVCRRADGMPWGMAALADGADPARVAWGTAAHAWADGRRLGIGSLLDASPSHLRVDLGPEARLDVRLHDRHGWPRRLGGVGLAHLVPRLSQYWHPHLLGARVAGAASLFGTELDLGPARVYAEKNWGAGGFPDAWWWGQAQAFPGRDDVCVAFAGGRAGIGPLHVLATSVVVRAGAEVLRLVRPALPLRLAMDRPGSWGVRLDLPGLQLELEGHARGAPHRLPVPLPARQEVLRGSAEQHLDGELRVALRRRGRTVVDAVSPLAGLERGSGRPAAPPR